MRRTVNYTHDTHFPKWKFPAKNIPGSLLILALLCIVLQNSSAQWTRIDNAFTFNDITTIAASGPYVFAGVESEVIYRSTNYGTTWALSLYYEEFTTLAASGANLIAGTKNYALHRSTNYGSSWSSFTIGFSDNEVTDIFFSGANVYVAMDTKFYYSSNSGSSWTSTSATSFPNIRSITVLGSNVYVATSGNGVYCSTNNGTDWSSCNTGLPQLNTDVISSNGTYLYTTVNPGGFYRSTDGGANWFTSSNGLSGTVTGIAYSGTTMYAGTEYGAYQSLDSGTTWSSINSGLTNTQVQCMTVSGSYMYVGTTSGEVFRYQVAPVQKFWAGSTGGGDGTSWSDALNWVNGILPGTADLIVLDNSLNTANYTVTLPGGTTNTTVASITITPDSGKTITLVLPSANTAVPALTVGNGTGSSYDFRLNSGALFKNQSGATAGNTITFANSTDSILIMNGARWLHNTRSQAPTVVVRLSKSTAGADQGIFEYDMPLNVLASIQGANYYYGTLVLSSTAAGGSKKYIRTGSSAMTVRGDFIINSGVRDSSIMTGTVSLYGNFINNGVQGFGPSSIASFTFTGTGEQTISGTGDINFNGGATINTASTVRLTKNVSVGTGRTFTVNGILDCDLFTVSGAGGFSLPSGKTLKTKNAAGVNGSIITSGSISLASGSSYEFNGSSAQVTGTNLPATVGTMTINNSAGVSLSKATTVSTALNFTAGNLTTNAFTLTLGGSGSIVGESSAKYLIGNLTTTKIVGTGASTLGNIGVSLSAGGDIGNVTATRVTGSGGIVTAAGNSGIGRKWTVSSTITPVSGRDITFSWVSPDDNSKNISSGAVNKSTNSGSTWTPVAAGNYSTRSALVSGETSFGMYTIGEDSAPLPVELVSFTASAVRLNTNLKWKTATEVNNHGFEVERRAVSDRHLQGDGHFAWTKAGFIEGHGTTNAPSEYFFVDKNLKTEKYAYRLKQVDRDGKFSYSQEVEVTVGGVPAVFALEQNYPNPFNPSTAIGFTLQVSGLTTLKIYDAIGREAATLVNENLEAGVYHQKTFDASRLASGIYFARLQGGTNVQMKKMILLK